jgi:hypothetical protein
MMRKKWLAAGLVLATGVVLLVPRSADAQVQFAIKGGLAYAKLSTDLGDGGVDLPELPELPSFGASSTFTGGVAIAIPLSSSFFFQPEALYQKRRSTLDVAAAGLEDDEFSVAVTYFEVPVLLKWQLATGSVRPSLFAGGSVGFRQSATVRTASGETAQEEDIKDDVKSTDFGVVVGAGLAFGSFGIEGRYNLGLSDVFVETSEMTAAKWRTWSFLASLTF